MHSCSLVFDYFTAVRAKCARVSWLRSAICPEFLAYINTNSSLSSDQHFNVFTISSWPTRPLDPYTWIIHEIINSYCRLPSNTLNRFLILFYHTLFFYLCAFPMKALIDVIDLKCFKIFRLSYCTISISAALRHHFIHLASAPLNQHILVISIPKAF